VATYEERDAASSQFFGDFLVVFVSSQSLPATAVGDERRGGSQRDRSERQRHVLDGVPVPGRRLFQGSALSLGRQLGRHTQLRKYVHVCCM